MDDDCTGRVNVAIFWHGTIAFGNFIRMSTQSAISVPVNLESSSYFSTNTITASGRGFGNIIYNHGYWLFFLVLLLVVQYDWRFHI